MLLEWLDEAALDRVGCFRYEPVAGAAANDLAAPVPKEVTEERWHRFMARQQAISKKRLKRKVGTRQQVIIDEVGPTVAKGRSQGRRAGDRRRGLCEEPAAAAGRRDRDRQDRARRRIRPARHRGRASEPLAPLTPAVKPELFHQLLLLGDQCAPRRRDSPRCSDRTAPGRSSAIVST